MCKPASFILTKDRVFWSRFTDSHEDIISEFSLNADGVKSPNIVRVEIVPPNGDMTRPAAEWAFAVDQDILPKWFDVEWGEKRARAALADWIAANVISNGNQERKEGRVFVVGSASAKLYDSASAELYGSASAELYGSASAKLKSRSTVIRWSKKAAVTLADEAVMVDRSGGKPVCVVAGQEVANG